MFMLKVEPEVRVRVVIVAERRVLEMHELGLCSCDRRRCREAGR